MIKISRMTRNTNANTDRALRICALAILLALLSIVPSTASAGVDLLFVNGAVYTANEHDAVAEALAVKDGRIVFVGSAAEGEDYRAEAGEVVDLAGGLLLPGFFDTHIHTPGKMWMDLFDIDLTGATSIEETVAAIRASIAKKPDKDVYHGFGCPTWVFTGDEAVKGPKKERLDELCPDKPVYIYSYDGHSMWVNSRAIEASGITAATEPPPGGVIEIDDVTGKPWGTLREAASTLTPRFAYDSLEMSQALAEFQASMNALGYTSLLSVAAMWDMLPVPFEEFHRMDVLRELTLKINAAAIFDATDDIGARVASILAMKERYDGRYLTLTTAKFFADGVVDSHTAWLLDPYEDEPTSRGTPFWEQGRLNEAFSAVNAAGLQAHIHSIGDAAARSALDAMEYARAQLPGIDRRNAITHLQIVGPDDLGRFAELSVVASTQPYWHYREPDFWEPVEYKALGARAKKQYPLKSLADTGAILTFSSDSPVTTVPNPLVAIETGVTRNMATPAEFGRAEIDGMDDPAYLLGPAERLSVREMIRGFTINSAYATFRENETGSLEVGKAADLVVLDTNILEIDPIKINEAKVLRTYLDGRLVYLRNED